MFKLCELVDIKGGGTPSRQVPEYWGGNIPWATVKDFKSTSLSETQESITEIGVANSATNVIPAGNIIVPTRMAVGKAAINLNPVAINQDLKALIPKDESTVDKKYLLRFLLSKAEYLNKRAKGATVKGITLEVLNRLEVSLPSLPEQRRIATIFDKSDEIRRKRQQAIQLADDFLKSLFLDMFGDLVSNSKNYPLHRIAEVLTNIQAGWSAKGDSHPPGDDEFGVLKISAVTTGTFKPEEAKTVREEDINRKLITVNKSDLLFSRANTRELVAAVAMADQDYDKLFLPDKLWKLNCNQRYVMPQYMLYALQNDQFRWLIRREASGTSGSMLNISKEKFKNIKIPVPPGPLQKKFGRIVGTTLLATTKQTCHLTSVNNLCGSLSSQFFNSTGS